LLTRRHIRKWILGTLALAGVSCQPDVIEQVTVPVTAVTVNPASLILQEGMSWRLEATVIPADATEPGLDWSSSDDRVATVDENGVVTAVAVGYANVIVKTRDGGKTAQCLVTVEGTTPPPSARWADTGADLPAWPSYNAVSNLEDFPRIDIRTNSGQPVRSKDTYEKGTISFRDPKKMYSDVTELKDLKMQIRGRGNTTWEGQWGAKNPYRIKLDEHTKVFGMKGDKDWILLSDRLDPTMMRTAVALRISRLVSMPWTPKFRMAEVYLNGKYAGLYYLVEQKEPDRENKIPITVAAAGETDGGYLLELDDKEDGDAYFWSSTFGKKIKYKNPDPNDDDASERMTAAQKSFITNYFNKVERKLAAREFTGDDSYKAYVEMDSWIQNFFVHEVSMNIDGNMRLSTYFAKDSDTKLFMPFVWDFDRAFGNADYQAGDFALTQTWPYGWFVRIRGGYPDWDTRGKKPSWYQYMFEDPEFVDRVKELWALYKPRLDMIPDFMDKMLEYDRLALQHNDTKFHNSCESRIRQLRDDYLKRLEWMDTNIKALKPQRYDQNTGTFQDL
jgi:Bacterial surface proteins containing Ig-like domains